ncbi:phospholipase domain-containing protein [Chryseobacterium sp. P1-3]|uniref:phospholipase domain-containing protein n=1 Tax=Chryseobacterium sp. (strain P1-3) TaxID=1517683 RepID=UPI000B26CCE5|nr:phospholipase domain-containing protein [Chryseobacterium sp. P1-3]
MDYLNQKDYAKTINAARNKPVPDLKWYSENELNDHLLEIQERGLKPSNPLPYNFQVNLEREGIKMTNLKEKGVPLLVYDRTQFNSNDYYFSYALYSKQELSHSVHSGAYDYEVYGPNGFFRKFKGDSSPELEVTLVNHISKSQVELIIKNNKKKNSLVLEDLYGKTKRVISLQKQEERIVFDLNQYKGWYDIKVNLNDHQWHFAGRIETGKVSVSDPHWA